MDYLKNGIDTIAYSTGVENMELSLVVQSVAFQVAEQKARPLTTVQELIKI